MDIRTSGFGTIYQFAAFAAICYGSGDDGPANFDGTNTFSFASKVGSVYTLTRDLFLADGAIVAPSATVNVAGFKVFGTGTLTNNGIIHCDGRDAVGGTAGAASRVGTLGIGTAGGNGRANNTGLNGGGQSNTLGDALLVGGAGGAGGVNAGGLGGTYVPSNTNGGAEFLMPVMTGFLFNSASGGNQATISIIGGGAGGGGGGSDNIGVTGGGGGGGVLILNIFNFVNNGIVRCAGGKGADAAGAGGNGGGGGGGAGGVLFNLSRYRSGAGVLICPGGLPGAGFGTGAAGLPGSDGHLDAFSA